MICGNISIGGTIASKKEVPVIISEGRARKPGSFTNPSSVIPAIGSSALK